MKLNKVPIGTPATITDVEGIQKRRMRDLGFVPGAKIEPVMRGPMGDPTAYDVKGGVFAIRSEDAEYITVRLMRLSTVKRSSDTILKTMRVMAVQGRR